MIRFLTAGESHGQALVGIIEGVPSGLTVTKEQIQSELVRRKQGHGRGDRQKIETEELQILSGVRHGKTLGSPITILIPNQDWKNWQDIMAVRPHSSMDSRQIVTVPRPGHADYVGAIKYQHLDMRNVLERSSARETTMRVAVGAIAKLFLKGLGVQISSQVVEIGGTKESEIWCDLIDQARSEGNTLGGIFEVQAEGVALGLGSYVQWDRRIEGQIGQAFLSLNAIKGVEIGLGFEAAKLKGSQVHDPMNLKETNTVGYSSNNSGGINGGMTSGEPLVVRAAMKPLSTMKQPLTSISTETKQETPAHYERSDICAVWSAAVIGESLLALELMNCYLEKFGGDSMLEIFQRVEQWKKAEKIFF